MSAGRDHCTLFPDGDWGGCCYQHDHAYKVLSAAAEYGRNYRRKRKLADRDLLVCVALGGRPWVAVIMFIGVRIFGSPIFAPIVKVLSRRS